ncbi:MAG TPA: hypothetical protein VKX16_12200 [Chloroflexota bacterium]|nr:hypothetical protein [Chloroflexota bacterium]
MNDVTERLNTLTIETTQTLIDSAYAAQKQNAELFQTWYEAVEKTQKTNRDLAVKLMKQSQELQDLWLKAFRESVRTTTNNFVKVADTQLDTVNRQVNGVKRETAAAK